MKLDDFVRTSLDAIGIGLRTTKEATIRNGPMTVKFDLVIATYNDELSVQSQAASNSGGDVEASRLSFKVDIDIEETLRLEKGADS